MKIFFKSFVVLVILTFSLAPTLVRAQDNGDDQDVSFQTFYDQLADQGNWIQTDDYGYVFQPNVSDPDWAPYTNGSWDDSPAGFYWDSDEPWGWATYHYGRWANIRGTGWVWVPGYRWAPAWVSWRYGDDYCGWAPLPPETLYGAEYGDSGADIGLGFHFGGDVDVAFGIGPEWYTFVRLEDFGDRDYRRVRFHRDRNFDIINHTTNITNLNVHNGGGANRFDEVAAGGPPLNEVNARSHQHIQTVNFTESNQPGKSTHEGNTVAVFAPKVDPNSMHQARPSRVGQTINHPTFNRGNSVTQPLEVTANVKPAPPTPEEIQAAKNAELHAPTTAKISTSHTPITSTLNKPLTSLTPVTHGPSNGNGEHHANGNAGGPINGAETQPHTFTPSNNQGNGGNGFKPEDKSTHTFNPQNQDNGGGGFKPENKPAPTFAPQNQDNGGNGFKPENKPAPTFAPQNQGGGGGEFKPEDKPIHTFNPQNQGGGGGGGNPGNNHPSGGQGGGGNAPANTGGNHASGGQGGGAAPSGNKGKNDPNKNPQPSPP